MGGAIRRGLSMTENLDKTVTPRKQRRLQWWQERLKQKDAYAESKSKRRAESERIQKATSDSSESGSLTRDCDRIAESGEQQNEDSRKQQDEEIVANKKQPKRRYILFVGNLPFTASADDVRDHFRARGVPVVAVRMLTERETGRSRGCCFVEFPNDRFQQIALKLQRSKLQDRSIKIEVTCGGGGGGERRREKLAKRNTTLVRTQLIEQRRKQKVSIEKNKVRTKETK